MVEGECDAWGRHESDDTTMFGYDESAAAWDGHDERCRGPFLVVTPEVTKEKSCHPMRSFTSVTIPFVGFPPVGDDASFFFLFFSPGFTFLFFFSLTSTYSLSTTPSSSVFFSFALPASVLGMYFLGDGMDRDRFGGLGHDICAFLKFPLRSRVISSQFSLISPSDLSSNV